MFINAVLIVLQEILEISFLISLLLVFSRLMGSTRKWIFLSLILGILFAAIYAFNLGTISAWFDYSGQEIVNAFIQIIMLILLSITAYILIQSKINNEPMGNVNVYFLLISILGITREGSEILIYLSGFFQQPSLSNVLIGGFVGSGIGLSTGILLFYILMMIPASKAIWWVFGLLCLIGGSLASQAVQLLIQSDWIPSTPPIWDTSLIISETSVIGRFLYALVGYEASPSVYQLGAYLTGVFLVFSMIFAARKSSTFKDMSS